jgi:hypothetical protein
MNALTISMISAGTALAASILGPVVTLTVAKRQFNANVISANRQKWIDTFRDHLADFIALISTASMIKETTASDQWRAGHGAVILDPSLRGIVEKIGVSFAQITLLTKEHDELHQQLIMSANQSLQILLSADKSQSDLDQKTGEVAKLGRSIIRYEWNRVKRGV